MAHDIMDERMNDEGMNHWQMAWYTYEQEVCTMAPCVNANRTSSSELVGLIDQAHATMIHLELLKGV